MLFNAQSSFSVTKGVVIQVKELGCLAFVSLRQPEGFFKIEGLQRPLQAFKIYT
jgi:hypothetical protein